MSAGQISVGEALKAEQWVIRAGPLSLIHTVTAMQPTVFRITTSCFRSWRSEGKYWVPAMADTPLRGYNGRHEWFWEPEMTTRLFIR